MSLADCIKKANSGKATVFNENEIKSLQAVANQNTGKMSVRDAEMAAAQGLLDQAIAERQALSDVIMEKAGIPVADAAQNPEQDNIHALQKELDGLLVKRDKIRAKQMESFHNSSATRAKTTTGNANADRVNDSIIDVRARIKALEAQPSKPLRMDGTARAERAKPAPTPEFSAVHPKAQEKFNAAWEEKDVAAMQEYLDPANKGLRAEFESRAGVKLPKTISGTDKVVADYFSEAEQPTAYELQQIGATSGEWKTVQKYKTKSEADAALPKGSGWRINKSEQPASAEAATIAGQNDLFERARNGEITSDEFKAGFAVVQENKESLTAELSAMTKPQLFDKFQGLSYRYKNENKASVVEAAYDDLLARYALGEGISYSMGKGSYERSIQSMVDKQTDETLAKYAEDIKAAKAERAAANAEALAGMKNPETLEDFQRIMAAKAKEIGEDATFAQARMAMPLEQRIKYDELVAEFNRGERAKRKVVQQEQSLRAPGEAVETTDIIQTKHTKHGHDLWQFQMVQRVSPDEFKSLATQAKRLGGNYSSYRGNGAIPGWQFRTEEAAKAFKTLVAGDATQAKDVAQARRDAYADDRSQTAVERLTEIAGKLDERADESLSYDRKQNTARRARFAASAESAANADKAMAQTMRNIAKGIEDGTAKMLDKVRQKVQVEMLQGFVNIALPDQLREKYPDFANNRDKYQGEQPNAETADYAKFPTYTAYRSDLANIGRALIEVDGTKKIGQQLMKVVDDVSDAYLAFAKDNIDKVGTFKTASGARAAFASKDAAEVSIARSNFRGQAIILQVKRGENLIILSPAEAIKRGIWEGDNDKRITLSPEFGAELVEKMGKAARRGAKVAVPWQLENAYDKRKRLSGMNIETPAELRAALREFIGLRKAPKEADKIKKLERAMIGRKNDGMDFFPTPAGVADEMIEAADIKPGMSVLEPSAGMGHIADRIREAGAEPDVIELSSDRRELLEAKGYEVVGKDFMDIKPREFFTYGDTFKAPDGKIGIMRGHPQGQLGNGRVALRDENNDLLGYYDRDELTPVQHNSTDSGYDRILMNPPFGDRRDAEHVMHAYELLKPGGRMVSIMGEGVFFGKDKTAKEFREWLEKVGGTDEKLDSGTFMDPSLPVNTGVSARMVVIDKADKNSEAVFNTQPGDAISEPNWMSTGSIVEEVDQLLKPFATEIPVLIRDTLGDIGVKGADDGVTSGAVYDGRIHLFRDGLADRAAVERTLWHELLHFGFRRFMTEDQYIAKMGDLYMRDGWVRGKANAWMQTAEAKKLAESKKPGYVKARAVDEALAELAEIMQTEPTGYQNNTKLAQAKRAVSEWIAKLADFFGFKDAAQAWRSYAAQKDARDLIVSTFAKLREGAPPAMLNSKWHYSDPAFMTAWHGSSKKIYTDADLVKYRQNNPLQSIGATGGQTVESVTKETAKLRATWHGFRNIKIIQSVKEVPNEIYLRALRALKPINQGTEGFYDPKTNSVYLIADNLASPERAVWVAIHEVVGHGGIRMLDKTVSASLDHAAKNGFVSQLAKAIAADRKETYEAKTHVEEAIAELAAASITGNTDEILTRYKIKVPAGMRSNLLGMIRRVVDAIRKFFAQANKKAEADVTDSDILGLLRQMKAKVEGKAQEAGQGNAGLAMASTKGDREISGKAFARMILEELSAENDAVFDNPVSNSKDLPSIIKEIVKADYHGEHTHADERTESGADHRYVFTTNEGKMFEVFETDDGRVWINVSKLETSGMGQKIYAAVANYAYNTGKVFIGDPAGLSKEAMFRRTSNMLSSALRFGTTRHLDAAKEQIDGDIENGIEPLDWRGSDIDKVEALIHTLTATAIRRSPQLKEYRYDFQMGRFTDGQGKPVTGAAISESVGGRKGIGEKTARRVVLLRTLLQSESQGIGQRNGILEQVLNWGASSTPDSLDNLFSRRVGTPDDRANSQNPAGAEPESQILRKGNARGIESDTSLTDKIVSMPFKLLRWDKVVSKPVDMLLEKTGELIPETIKAGIVSNYGLPSEYTESKDDMRAREAAMNRKAHGLIEMLSGLNRAESRVAYYWMQEKPGSEVEKKLLDQLPEQSREVMNTLKTLITDMGKEAVRLGQMSPESFERNSMAYLHRTYATHVLAEEGKIGQFMRARATKIKGNQYKGRGIFDEVGMSSIGGDPTAWRKLQQGRADKSLVGEKLIRFERRDASSEVMDALPGMTSKPMGKLREVVYWPESTPVPAKFGDWVNSGTFEVRDTKGDKLVVWRDLTREERERLGELDEVRYAVAQTMQMMIHDIEVGRFLEWTAKEYGRVTPEGKEVAASESMLRAYHQNDWVLVPNTNIHDTKTKKYGALSGMYVPGSVWNDIRQTAGGRIEPLGKTYAAALRFWKKSKTVWSPGVHMNNVMGNFVMADWHDMRAVDLADALRVWAMNDKPGYKELFNRFQDSGALGGMFQSNEVMRDEIKQRLEEIKADLKGEQDAAKEMGTMAKVLQLVSLATVKPAKDYANVTAKAYQSEDEVFRLAMFLKAIRHGKTDIEAGRMARHAFLNYDINAPWVQAARQTGLPFLSFFYRAAPMMLDTAKNKPWKIAKLIGFAYLINALGYAMSGGDEDKDRKLLPDEKSGGIWGLVPKMIRMPWNNENSAPVFLDVRRWVPVGDIADMEMGSGMLPPWATPSGPLVALIEAAMFNKSMFTKQDITKDTDTLSEETEKRIDYLFKSMMPNIPLPNPMNMQIGGMSINPFNLDQGSLQTYGWSGIEKAVDRKENAIGEVRTLPQAIVNSIGVKVGAYPHDNMKAAITLEFKKNVAEIKSEAQKALRNFTKLENPTSAQIAAKNREVERLREKLKKESNRVHDKVN